MGQGQAWATWYKYTRTRGTQTYTPRQRRRRCKRALHAHAVSHDQAKRAHAPPLHEFFLGIASPASVLPVCLSVGQALFVQYLTSSIPTTIPTMPWLAHSTMPSCCCTWELEYLISPGGSLVPACAVPRRHGPSVFKTKTRRTPLDACLARLHISPLISRFAKACSVILQETT